MMVAIKLLLPALVPSWRFFDRVAASPRIEFALFSDPGTIVQGWQEFRPRPNYLSFGDMLKRMFWNPRWNESLFLVSCAERLMHNGEAHCVPEIANRIKTELQRSQDSIHAAYLQFRLVFIHREGERLQKEVTFVSPAYPLEGA